MFDENATIYGTAPTWKQVTATFSTSTDVFGNCNHPKSAGFKLAPSLRFTRILHLLGIVITDLQTAVKYFLSELSPIGNRHTARTYRIVKINSHSTRRLNFQLPRRDAVWRTRNATRLATRQTAWTG